MSTFNNRSIYLITDDSKFNFNILFEKVKQSIDGGTSIVQLREKHSNSLDFYRHALKIKELCKKYNVLFIINDRLDIAQAVGADGVHLGQSDLPLNISRDILGNGKIIGASARTLEDALKAQNQGADYLGVGAVFSTKTKKDAKHITKADFLNIRNNISIPIYAIGGININNAIDIKDYKANGIAISSAILNASDSKEVTTYFRDLF